MNDVVDISEYDKQEARDMLYAFMPLCLYAMFLQMATIEIGENFCGRKDRNASSLCDFDREMFDRAMDRAYGNG
ncbi:hypothetical protein [Teredinibacter haidensis]|uniref:hypothetical protein n=1 Tax=Teredinibacter haidensis TaxID=2731755 RepID=UPI000948AB95|nr:hypothetical protein [Teredinibacter haidensis]